METSLRRNDGADECLGWDGRQVGVGVSLNKRRLARESGAGVVPASAGMTVGRAGMTVGRAGMTVGRAG